MTAPPTPGATPSSAPDSTAPDSTAQTAATTAASADGSPVPVDDGAADHLRGMRVPSLALPTTDGTLLRLADPPPGGAHRLVVYTYPRTATPGEAVTRQWSAIPGARGCTPEACGFRDHAADLRAAGAAVVGVSTQDTGYQRELVARLGLPFPLLSDADLRLAAALRLPTLQFGGRTLLRRLTIALREGRIEHVFYPVSRLTPTPGPSCAGCQASDPRNRVTGCPGNRAVGLPRASGTTRCQRGCSNGFDTTRRLGHGRLQEHDDTKNGE